MRRAGGSPRHPVPSPEGLKLPVLDVLKQFAHRTGGAFRFLLRGHISAAAAALITTLVLVGCASAPITQAPATSTAAEAAWGIRQVKLAAVATWTLKGRIAVNNNAATDITPGTEINSAPAPGAINISAMLHWAQQPSDYHIDVVPPFGQGAIRLEGNSEGVVMRLPGGRQLSAASPDALLYAQTGLRLPIRSLRYWVMGRPDPASEVRKVLDDTGRALWLEQSGWRVEFLRYTQINGLDMPDKLVMTRSPMHLRLVIDRWEL